MSIFVAIPTYDWKSDIVGHSVLEHECAVRGDVGWIAKGSSLINFNCNMLYAECLNRRRAQLWRAQPGITHFLMMHADVRPESGFITKMLAIMEARQADVVSVVIPMKDRAGLVSTGANVKFPDGGLFRRRLSTTELQKLPTTFDAGDVARLWKLEPLQVQLIVNTGLLLVNLQAPWVEAIDEHGQLKVCFQSVDTIFRREEKWFGYCESEDWFYSRKVNEQGGKIVATREVKVDHFGNYAYSNQEVWGETVDKAGLWPGAT